MNRGLEMRGLTLAEASSRVRSGEYARPAGGIARGRVQTNLLVTGTVLAVLGTNPVAALVFAQAANGVLLPIIAVFLLSVIIVLFAALVGVRTILLAFGITG
jgi:Mn2+/Fe2+ NRAMP family transporter